MSDIPTVVPVLNNNTSTKIGIITCIMFLAAVGAYTFIHYSDAKMAMEQNMAAISCKQQQIAGGK